MDARPAPDVYDEEVWEVAAAYRVTLWEQPSRQPESEAAALGVEPLPRRAYGVE